MDNVQKHNTCNNIPSSQTFKSYMLTEPLPSDGLFHVYLLQWEYVFGKLLASNGLPPWLHYSGFQALYFIYLRHWIMSNIIVV
jgi:hypothetical protein